MKIIHCADIHLGSKMQTNLSVEKSKERKEEIFDTFLSMIKYAKENNIEHIIISGDLFDTKVGNNLLIKKVLNVFNKNNNIKFYYLQGNHDDVDLRDYDIPSNVILFDDGFSKVDLENVSIGGLKIDSETNYDIIDFDNNKFNILLLHGNITTSKNLQNDDFNLNDLKNRNINYIALGHIHSNKVMKIDDNCIACYSGCLEGRGFDETGKKGFYVLDIVGNNLKYDFVSLSKRSLYEITVDITNVDDLYSEIKKSLEEYKKSDLFKVILKGEYNINCDKQVNYITSKLNEEFYFVKIYDESKLKINYKDYENDVSLLGEFVRTVLNNKDLNNDEKNAVLTYGINALIKE